jgi:hypothetical protein
MTTDEVTPPIILSEWVRRLRRAAETGEPLDLAAGEEIDPTQAASWGPERSVPPRALRVVLIDPDCRVDARGLNVRGARFDGRIDLAFVDFPHPLRLVECASTVALDVEGGCFRDLELRRLYSQGEVRVQGAQIGAELNLSGATLRNAEGRATATVDPPNPVLNLTGAKIINDVVAKDFTVEGMVQALGVRIGGQLKPKWLVWLFTFLFKWRTRHPSATTLRNPPRKMRTYTRVADVTAPSARR